MPSTVRIEKGIDIDAGCGQLRARVVDAEVLGVGPVGWLVRTSGV